MPVWEGRRAGAHVSAADAAAGRSVQAAWSAAAAATTGAAVSTASYVALPPKSTIATEPQI